MKASMLKKKDVVKMSDGSIAGKIIDFEFNISSYEIQAVCIKEKQSFFKELLSLFQKERVLVMDVSKIVQIGKDVIFADLPSYEKK
ncbi:MAG: PRC-barrel domain-containing protein [Erysipelotrichaceae bacterium]|nr:PRC-barrel domain-containing protein [Erysipelotrichaceae bacterium]